jgi:hypothetical protein
MNKHDTQQPDRRLLTSAEMGWSPAVPLGCIPSHFGTATQPRNPGGMHRPNIESTKETLLFVRRLALLHNTTVWAFFRF